MTRLTLIDDNKRAQECRATSRSPSSPHQHSHRILHEQFPLEKDSGDEMQRSVHRQHPFEHLEESRKRKCYARIIRRVHGGADCVFDSVIWGRG